MDGGQQTPASLDSSTARLHPGLTALLLIGPIMLFLATMAFGVLEVHSSTDTWIGLAAGRQIWTADEFPKTDTFSYTFNGKVWYNQNWLTHLFQYCLYRKVSPNAVIYGTWALSALVFVFALLAAYWRSGTLVGAILAAAMVGLGCRDFLSARPATTGFFCIAAIWALVCAIEGQRDKRRWWPIVLLLPLLLVWGNAHGSFVFGYGVLGLYVGRWFVVRTIRVKHSWAFSLILVLLVMAIGGLFYSRVPAGVKTSPDEVLTLGKTAYYKTKVGLICAVLAAYVVYWLCIRGFRPRLAIHDRQVAAIVGVVVIALILTVAFGPFGTHNFTHGQKIAGSSVFRQVSEWNPPFERNLLTRELTFKPDLTPRNFPPMARFWWILRGTLGLLGAGLVLWLATFFSERAKTREPPAAPGARRRRPPAQREEKPVSSGPGLHVSLFDVALVILGLSMTFWARRFAPIFYIFAAPVLLTWVVLLLRPLPRRVRLYGQAGLALAAAIAAVFVARDTWGRAYESLVAKFEGRPEFNLLERITQYSLSSHEALLFVKNNELELNVVTEWTQAGPVMFYAPNAKVFMDGRAQQVYDEEHYKSYAHLLVSPDTPATERMRILNDSRTDAVLLRRFGHVIPLWRVLEQSPEWVLTLLGPSDALFLRRGGRGLEQLGERLRRGDEWRPMTAMAMMTRGFVWQALDPPNPERAVVCWKEALDQNVLIGAPAFAPLTETLLELGRKDEARQLIQQYYQQVQQYGRRIPENVSRDLLQKLGECWAEIESAAPATSRPAERGEPQRN